MELLVLGLSGMLFGAGLSARRRGAPLLLARAFYVGCAVCLVLAVLTFRPNS